MKRIELRKGIVTLREPLRRDKNLMEAYSESEQGKQKNSLYFQKAEELLSTIEGVKDEEKITWLNLMTLADARKLRIAVIEHLAEYTLSEDDKKKLRPLSGKEN